MALPASGAISISQINTELGRSSTTVNTSLQALANLARTNTTPYINRATPKISHWHGYTHVINGVLATSWITRTLTNSTQSTTGTITISGISANFYAQAISQSNSEVNVSMTINGITKAAFRVTSGTNNSTQFTLSPGTYNYSVDVTVNSGTGQGGIIYTQ